MTLTDAQVKATAEGRCCRWCRAPLDHTSRGWVNSGGWEWCTNRKHETGHYIEAEALAAPSSPALDVERLARALQHSNHGTRCRDKFGAAYTFDELSDEGRRSMRDDADNIAAAYESES